MFIDLTARREHCIIQMLEIVEKEKTQMKRKLLAAFMSLAIIAGMTGCGASTNSDDAEYIEELEQEIEDLEDELAELRGKQAESADEEKTREQETWSDDTVIAFTSSEMLESIRCITGITSRDITYGDVKGITSLGDYTWTGGLEPLKYFTGLITLDIGGGLWADVPDTNLEPLGNLNNLMTLEIHRCHNLSDISAIANITSLKELCIDSCDNLTDVSVLEKLENLERLTIKYCDNISAIGSLEKLSYVQIYECKKLPDQYKDEE